MKKSDAKHGACVGFLWFSAGLCRFAANGSAISLCSERIWRVALWRTDRTYRACRFAANGSNGSGVSLCGERIEWIGRVTLWRTDRMDRAYRFAANTSAISLCGEHIGRIGHIAAAAPLTPSRKASPSPPGMATHRGRPLHGRLRGGQPRRMQGRGQMAPPSPLRFISFPEFRRCHICLLLKLPVKMNRIGVPAGLGNLVHGHIG